MFETYYLSFGIVGIGTVRLPTSVESSVKQAEDVKHENLLILPIYLLKYNIIGNLEETYIYVDYYKTFLSLKEY